MRIFIVIATLGRPEVLRCTVARLERQTRLPDGVLISAVYAADATGLDSDVLDVRVLLGEKGSCRQRNHAIAALGGKADVILFLDDDFVAADDYLAELEALFTRRPDLVGATGRVIADGIVNAGYSFEDAVTIVERDVPTAPATEPRDSLYGCNMAIRTAAAEGLEFDEDLPLYGWLEDVDYTYRLGRNGPMLLSTTLRGVHMGTKGGRTSGDKLGYSQIANPIYLLRKRGIPREMAFTMMRNNLLANMGRSFRPEPHIDRRGRLRGNLRAGWDLLRGRLHPRRILELE